MSLGLYRQEGLDGSEPQRRNQELQRTCGICGVPVGSVKEEGVHDHKSGSRLGEVTKEGGDSNGMGLSPGVGCRFTRGFEVW